MRLRQSQVRFAVLCLLALTGWLGRVLADEITPPLFSSHQPVKITLIADFKNLLYRKNWTRDRWYDGRIEIQDEDGAKRLLHVRLKPRGGFRTRDKTCYFPQLFLDFSSAETDGTVFDGQKVIPLTTHCRGSSTYSSYIYRELMAYRLYNLFADKSLRPRAALVTYMRADKPEVVAKRYAFFVEHFDDLAARLDARIVEIEGFHPLGADAFEMGVLDLFQFMVGNTDWSAAFQHNILLLKEEDKSIVAVPYDFDFSGLVNAKYATPGPQFRARSVRTRIYRGYCRDDGSLQGVFDYFQAKRPKVFALLEEFDWIPASVLSDSRSYLGSFYDLLDSPEKLRAQIERQCGRGRPVASKSGN